MVEVSTAAGEPQPRDLSAFTPSGDLRTVWIGDAVVDYVAGTVRPMPDLGHPVVELSPSPDGTRLLVATGPSGVGLVDATTMRWIAGPRASEAGLMGPTSTWSDDGSLVASVGEGRLSHWNGKTGEFLGSASVLPNELGDPGFAEDEERLLFAGDDGSVLSWDLDPASWTRAACRLAGRGLTEQEWRTHLPNRPFRKVCTP